MWDLRAYQYMSIAGAQADQFVFAHFLSGMWLRELCGSRSPLLLPLQRSLLQTFGFKQLQTPAGLPMPPVPMRSSHPLVQHLRPCSHPSRLPAFQKSADAAAHVLDFLSSCDNVCRRCCACLAASRASSSSCATWPTTAMRSATRSSASRLRGACTLYMLFFCFRLLSPCLAASRVCVSMAAVERAAANNRFRVVLWSSLCCCVMPGGCRVCVPFACYAPQLLAYPWHLLLPLGYPSSMCLFTKLSWAVVVP